MMKERILREARRIGAQAYQVLLKLRIGNRWAETEEAFARRQYPSYDDYLKHQRTKLHAFRHRSIERHDSKFFAALSERLGALPLSFQHKAVLCLAARQGSEVRAFIAQGAFAVGVDLNPGQGNRFVVTGDFHDLQFADRSVDVVYTNSIDHAYDLERLLAEVWRVLTDDGLLITEVARGAETGNTGQGFYEAFSWASLDQLRHRIEACGFKLERQAPFEIPWEGEQLVLRKRAAAA